MNVELSHKAPRAACINASVEESTISSRDDRFLNFTIILNRTTRVPACPRGLMRMQLACPGRFCPGQHHGACPLSCAACFGGLCDIYYIQSEDVIIISLGGNDIVRATLPR